MIELKFTVDDDLTEQDLRHLLYFRHYSSALYEIKEKIFQIRDRGQYRPCFGEPTQLDENCRTLIDFLVNEINEICEYLPKEY